MEGHAIALPTVSGETSAKMAAAHETGGIPWKPESSPARSTYTPECRERMETTMREYDIIDGGSAN